MSTMVGKIVGYCTNLVHSGALKNNPRKRQNQINLFAYRHGRFLAFSKDESCFFFFLLVPNNLSIRAIVSILGKYAANNASLALSHNFSLIDCTLLIHRSLVLIFLLPTRLMNGG
jgi:hypothetical protein